MTSHYSELQQIVSRVLRRWRLLTLLRAWAVGAALAALTLALAFTTQHLLSPEGRTLIFLWAAALIAALAPLIWSLASARRVPDDRQVARYIEECCPELDDVLATAIAGGGGDRISPMLEVVVEDALRRVRGVDANRIVSRVRLRRAGLHAAAATTALVIIAGLSAGPVGRAGHLLALYMFPERLGLEVTPGNVRLRAGEPLRILAHISGSHDGIVPLLRLRRGEEVREVPMKSGPGGFVAALEHVDQGFRYAVAAAGTVSREYEVTVLQTPHVERIDLRYEFPAAFGLQPRVEEDSGDIYGPAGSRVRLSIHTDKPVTQAQLTLADHKTIALAARGQVLEGTVTIAEDGSYRIALTDADGITNPGDTEYFIRTLSDRPPDVRIVRPVGDRDVTPLEEVLIEARADDDFGIAALELVYSVRGTSEKVVPFERDSAGTTVNGQRTVYLEDLDVQPGDFVTYYARARDVSRGKRSTEARSDIFFLEIKPFDAEFVAAQSQANSGGGGNQQVDDLISAQKDVIAATWKLDRRGRETGGRSQDDIRAVARAQGEVKTRAEGSASQFRRAIDPNRLRGGRAGAGAPAPSDDPMSKAVEAMGRAQQQLESLKTAGALPHEMAALNELMRAEAEVRRREVQRQQANGGGRGSNRQQQDLSTLFDRELARQQQTNYETPNSRETREENPNNEDALEKIRELARRQEALNREQQDVAKNRQSMSEDEFRRQLERLTRDETELRRQAEELSRQIQQQRGQGQGKGQPLRGGGQPSDETRALQQASEEMQNAASDLRRRDPSQASASGSRALERLREQEQRMRGAQPDDRRRALGELQLESQQLAEEQRKLASEPPARGNGGAREDTARRRSGEQERLADRMQRLEQSVRELAGRERRGNNGQSEALAEAAREVDQQRLSSRMRNAARAERERASDRPDQSATDANGKGQGSRSDPAEREASAQSSVAREEQDIAKGIDRLGARLGSANQDNQETRRLADRLSRVRELRDKMNDVDKQLQQLSRNGGREGSGQSQARAGDPQQAGEGRSQGQQPGNAPSGPTGGNGATSWQQTRDLLDELRQEQGLRSPQADLQGFQPGLSAPGTEAWKQDFAKWEELKRQLTAALEKAETTAASQLRDQQAKDRLNAGATQAVPEQYRQLVDKYYRALASKPKDQR